MRRATTQATVGVAPLGLLVVGVLVATLLPAAPARAAGCLPAGGASIPAATPAPGDFMISGRGWGHGVGMSQYGAQGAGNLGCTPEQILTTYFPGTSVGSAALPPTIRVSLSTAARSVPVEAHTGPIPWEVCTTTCTTVGTQAAGSTWTVAIQVDGSYRLSQGSTTVWQGGSTSARLRARLDGHVARVRVATAYRYRWGLVEFASRADAPGTAYVTTVLPFRQYLYGLSEVPSSWPAATLQAQAIAGRSYALKRVQRYGGDRAGCRCDVYATVVDQHFTGYEKAAEPTYGRRWTDAVDATAGLVLRYGDAIADTFYSSSHGGYSESSRFVWGGSVPYLQPVNDTRWEQHSSNPPGNLTWARTFSAEQVGGAFGVGRALSVDLPPPHGHGGRVGDPDRGAGGVVVRGTSGTRRMSGDEFRRKLGLKSTLFTVTGGPPQLSWSGWAAQPGHGLTAPAAVSWADGRTDLFAVDGAGRLRHRWLNAGQAWGPAGGWEQLWSPPGVAVVGQPAVVSPQEGWLDVFVRGSDGQLWQLPYRTGSGWGRWLPRGGVLTSSPSVVSWGPDHLAIFVVGADGAVWSRTWSRGWEPWQSVGGDVTSTPAATSWGRGRIDLFARGTNGALYHRWYSGGRWSGGWGSRGGILHGDGRPEAVAWGPGRLDVFVIGRDGSGVWRQSYQSGYGWLPASGYAPMGTPGSTLQSGTAALSWRERHLEVFATDTDGRVWHRWTT